MFRYFYLLSAGSAILVHIQFDGEHYVHLPVRFSLPQSRDTIEGYIELDFGPYTPTLHRQWPDISNSLIAVSGYELVCDELFYESFGEFGQFLDTTTQTTRVSADPNSPFAFTDFIIYPISRTQGVLEMEPINPAAHALDNELYYTVPSTNMDAWIVNGIMIQLTTNDEAAVGDSLQCTIGGSTSAPTVPNHIFDTIVNMLRELRMTFTYSDGLFGFEQALTADQLAQLPTIQFTLQTDSDIHVRLATLEPREYISENGRVFNLKTSRTNPSSCILTGAILKKLIVHFDSNNNRIGFGEPISQL